jgi:hypothetical protein
MDVLGFLPAPLLFFQLFFDPILEVGNGIAANT